jgi:hypothetical protein
MIQNVKDLNNEAYKTYGMNVNKNKIALSNIISFLLAIVFTTLMVMTLKVIPANIFTGSIIGTVSVLAYVIITNKIFSKIFK